MRLLIRTLHPSHSFLTEVRTFMDLLCCQCCDNELLFTADIAALALESIADVALEDAERQILAASKLLGARVEVKKVLLAAWHIDNC